MNRNQLKKLIVPYTRDGAWECDYDLRGVMRFLESQAEDRINMNLDPDFQRGHVWTADQQSAWLAHILRGGKNGRRIFFNHPGWQGSYKGVMELIDGKQRLEAVRAFLADEVKVLGYTYSELAPSREARLYLLSRNTLRLNVNTLPNRAAVLQWYLEMNDGGTPHTADELARVREMLNVELRAALKGDSCVEQ
jgi:hypothetical protein